LYVYTNGRSISDITRTLRIKIGVSEIRTSASGRNQNKKMKHILLSLVCLFTLPAWADQGVSPDISTVVSVDSWKEKEYRPDVGPYYRYRASLHNALKSEAMPWLEVEKLFTGDMGSSVTTKWETRIDVTTNTNTKKAYTKICGENAPLGLDCEAKM